MAGANIEKKGLASARKQITATYEQIQGWIEEAKKLPEKPERTKEQVFKGKGIVELLYDVTKDLRNRGYTFHEIVSILKTQDGNSVLKDETFKAYFKQIDRERTASTATSEKKTSKKRSSNRAGRSADKPGTSSVAAKLEQQSDDEQTSLAKQEKPPEVSPGTTDGALQTFSLKRTERY